MSFWMEKLEPIGSAVSCRGHLGDGQIARQDVYRLTGIQCLPFNTFNSAPMPAAYL